jgi:alkylation response protein AidB-like acyl-CoA dehydrogenase
MTTATERAQAIIDGLGNQKSGYDWLTWCNSPTAFIKTWVLGRAGRRLAMLAAENSKTAARGAARGYVIARHALIALEKLAKKAKSEGSQPTADFLHFVFSLGAWAARAVGDVLDIPPARNQKRNHRQSEFAFSILSTQ